MLIAIQGRAVRMLVCDSSQLRGSEGGASSSLRSSSAQGVAPEAVTEGRLAVEAIEALLKDDSLMCETKVQVSRLDCSADAGLL